MRKKFSLLEDNRCDSFLTLLIPSGNRNSKKVL